MPTGAANWSSPLSKNETQPVSSVSRPGSQGRLWTRALRQGSSQSETSGGPASRQGDGASRLLGSSAAGSCRPASSSSGHLPAGASCLAVTGAASVSAPGGCTTSSPERASSVVRRAESSSERVAWVRASRERRCWPGPVAARPTRTRAARRAATAAGSQRGCQPRRPSQRSFLTGCWRSGGRRWRGSAARRAPAAAVRPPAPPSSGAPRSAR